MNRDGVVSTARSVVQIGRDTELSFQAASVAFFAFFSLIPALLLGLAIGTLVAGELFAERTLATVEGYLTEQGQQVVSEALAEPQGQVGASAIGFLALVWSSLKVFRAIDIAFDQIYRTDKVTPLPRQLINGVVTLLAIGIGIAVLVGTQILIIWLRPLNIPFLGLLGWLVLLAGLVVVFLPLYYVLTPVSVTVREVFPGTVTAVFGWLVLQLLFQVYAAHAGQYQAFGFVGAVLLFLLWLYFAAAILLFGAVVNVATAGRLD